MEVTCSFSGIVPRPDDRLVFNVFHLSGRRVDIAADDQHYRTAQQGVQTSYEADGNRGRRVSLLHLVSLYLIENGAELALKPCWKSAQKFTAAQGRKFHTIILTPPLLARN